MLFILKTLHEGQVIWIGQIVDVTLGLCYISYIGVNIKPVPGASGNPTDLRARRSEDLISRWRRN
jgi:hypothetical protein